MLSTLIKKCDKLWAKIIRSQGYCEKCGKTSGLQAAHIISRSHHGTRALLENGVCLCNGCHIFWSHKEPDEWVDWIREKYGVDVYDDLRDKAKKYREMTSREKRDYYEKVYETLKQVADFEPF